MPVNASWLPKKPISITATAYTLKALALAGAFYCFNDFPIRLKQYPIPGTKLMN